MPADVRDEGIQGTEELHPCNIVCGHPAARGIQRNWRTYRDLIRFAEVRQKSYDNSAALGHDRVNLRAVAIMKFRLRVSKVGWLHAGKGELLGWGQWGLRLRVLG